MQMQALMLSVVGLLFLYFFCNVFIELFNYIHGFYLFSIYIYIHMNSIPLLLTSKYDSISIDLQVVLHS